MSQDQAHISFDDKQKQLRCSGRWSVLQISAVLKEFTALKVPENESLIIDGTDITHFDSAGALALHHAIEHLKKQVQQVELCNFSERAQQLLQLIEDKEEHLSYSPPDVDKKNVFYQVGKESENKLEQVKGFVDLIGDFTAKIISACGDWSRFQIPSIMANIGSSGIKALPILALLSFLIGVVLAYQMGLQLSTYGANSFIAYLSGMAIFREFAPLITAIIVAGRTSSAITAQIGSMKMNEEIDALLTMGLSPTELLVLPKVLGLLIAFPLLIFWSDLFSVLGSIFMANNMLGIGMLEFMQRLRDSVGIAQFKLGLFKAPAFALLISLVGCYQGFQVESGTEHNIGSQTTKSVVQSLFLIIIADAVYSIVYSWMHL